MTSTAIQQSTDTFHELEQKIQEFIAKVNNALDWVPGFLSDLIQPIKDGLVFLQQKAKDVALDKLQANLDWQGRGAEAYKATVPAQVSGLNSVKDLANQLRSSLDNLANGINTFWVAMGVADGVFLVGAIGAIAAACTVVGIPAAIAAIATAAGVAIGLVTTAILSVMSLMNTISTSRTPSPRRCTTSAPSGRSRTSGPCRTSRIGT